MSQFYFEERRPIVTIFAQQPKTIACLVEGNSIRSTARIMGLDKDTVAGWLKKASKHVEAVSRYLMVNLHFE